MIVPSLIAFSNITSFFYPYCIRHDCLLHAKSHILDKACTNIAKKAEPTLHHLRFILFVSALARNAEILAVILCNHIILSLWLLYVFENW